MKEINLIESEDGLFLREPGEMNGIIYKKAESHSFEVIDFSYDLKAKEKNGSIQFEKSISIKLGSRIDYFYFGARSKIDEFELRISEADNEISYSIMFINGGETFLRFVFLKKNNFDLIENILEKKCIYKKTISIICEGIYWDSVNKAYKIINYNCNVFEENNELEKKRCMMHAAPTSFSINSGVLNQNNYSQDPEFKFIFEDDIKLTLPIPTSIIKSSLFNLR